MSAGAGAGKAQRTSRQIDTYSDQLPHLSVSPALFEKFQTLIYSETGIWLGSSKTALLCGRLFRRLRTLGITSLESYYECVAQPDQQEERERMIDAITTNETRFLREPGNSNSWCRACFRVGGRTLNKVCGPREYGYGVPDALPGRSLTPSRC